MRLPLLPPPTVVDGRLLYTAADMRNYGQKCFEAGGGDPEPHSPIPPKKPLKDGEAFDFLMETFGMKK